MIAYLQVQEGTRSNGAAWPWRAVILAVETGARVGEIESLRWRAVSFGKRVLTLDGKTGPRDVPITARLLEELKAWRLGREHPEWFVLGVRGHIVRSRGNNKLSEACAALKQPAFSWHGVRRRYVRELARAGVPVRVAAELMGHSPGVMLNIYDECTEEDKVEAIASLEAFRRARPLAEGDAVDDIDDILGAAK